MNACAARPAAAACGTPSPPSACTCTRPGSAACFLSANAMPEEIALARSHGATDYWTKPLDFQRFLAGIAQALAGVTVD